MVIIMVTRSKIEYRENDIEEESGDCDDDDDDG